MEEILWYENVWRPQVEKAEYTEIEEAWLTESRILYNTKYMDDSKMYSYF